MVCETFCIYLTFYVVGLRRFNPKHSSRVVWYSRSFLYTNFTNLSSILARRLFSVFRTAVAAVRLDSVDDKKKIIQLNHTRRQQRCV